MTTTTTTITRTGYVIIVMLMSLTEWFITQFNPAMNGIYWLCGAIGALGLRFLLPRTPLAQSLTGWFIGFAFACLTARTALRREWFGAFEPELTWATLGLLGDAALQLAAGLLRIVRNVLGYAEEKPGEAFDEGMTRAERLLTVWVKFKEPLGSLLDRIFPHQPPNPPPP